MPDLDMTKQRMYLILESGHVIQLGALEWDMSEPPEQDELHDLADSLIEGAQVVSESKLEKIAIQANKYLSRRRIDHD